MSKGVAKHVRLSDAQVKYNDTHFPPDLKEKGGQEPTVKEMKAKIEYERQHMDVAMDDTAQDFSVV